MLLWTVSFVHIAFGLIIQCIAIIDRPWQVPHKLFPLDLSLQQDTELWKLISIMLPFLARNPAVQTYLKPCRIECIELDKISMWCNVYHVFSIEYLSDEITIRCYHRHFRICIYHVVSQFNFSRRHANMLFLLRMRHVVYFLLTLNSSHRSECPGNVKLLKRITVLSNHIYAKQAKNLLNRDRFFFQNC